LLLKEKRATNANVRYPSSSAVEYVNGDVPIEFMLVL